MAKNKEEVVVPLMKTIRLLFICKKRIDSYGISFGLINSARFTSNALAEKGIEVKVVEVIDNNSIDREVYNWLPTHVFIEAIWVVPEKFKVLLSRYPVVKWIVRVHSQIPFIANEGNAFEWLFEYQKLRESYWNFRISFNNKNACNDFEKVGINNIYLPNVYTPNYDVERTKQDDGVIDIGCFGSIRPMKNHLLQAHSAITFANLIKKELRFHVNSSRVEQKGESALKNIRSLFKYSRHTLIEHDWMPHQEFLKVVANMNMCMQVSFSETFNIVTADAVYLDVPVVVSKEIFWLPFWTKAPATIGESIVDRMKLVWLMRKIRLHKMNKLYLDDYNQDSILQWLSFLHNDSVWFTVK